MKSTLLYSILIIFAFLNFSCETKKTETDNHEHQTASPEVAPADTIKKSIPKEEHAQIGTAHLMIKYHAPAVRGRTIWGGLVPYDEVWVTGAHSATSFEIDKDIRIGEKEVPAGKYALFTIPGKEKWTIILNKNWEQHLADDYDQKEDMVRLEVSPEITENIQERLKYTLKEIDDSSGSVDIRWEKIKVSMPFQIK